MSAPSAMSQTAFYPSVVRRQTAQDISAFLQMCRPRPLRTMRQFAEQEIICPNGPFKNRKFRCEYQPFSGLWFDAIDSGNWHRFVVFGPQQDGKSLIGYVIPCLYYLFERGETVVLGLPDMTMASDKWKEDILPVIMASRYRELLPERGSGTKGGTPNRIQFTNGAALRFMSGGGGDGSRAGYTSDKICITETDKMDDPGAKSDEADKITQIIGRASTEFKKARIFLECTVTTTEGRTFKEYQNGTASVIKKQCPHCFQWVCPEREHLLGWQEALTDKEAGRGASFYCPGCGERITESERYAMNRRSLLVHRGQEVTPEGEVVGPMPDTYTLGFRWNAFDSMFEGKSAEALGAGEWAALRAPDPEIAERGRLQYFWAVPVKPSKVDLAELNYVTIMKRRARWARGIVPADAAHVTVGVDLNYHSCDWVTVAWRPHAAGHVVDYGMSPVPSSEHGFETAIMMALRNLRDTVFEEGWLIEDSDDHFKPDLVLVDSSYQDKLQSMPVYGFIEECWHVRKNAYRAAKGYGVTQVMQKGGAGYRKQSGSMVLSSGLNYHLVKIPRLSVGLMEIQCDAWKTRVHQQLSIPLKDETIPSGAITLFNVDRIQEHSEFAQQLCAEHEVEDFVAGKGTVLRWEKKRRDNHKLDCLYMAAAAGYHVGVRLFQEEKRQMVAQKPAEPAKSFTTPDGRPFYVGNRVV